MLNKNKIKRNKKIKIVENIDYEEIRQLIICKAIELLIRSF